MTGTSDVQECTSDSSCMADSDVLTASNWQCNAGKCNYKGRALRNWVGDCAKYCGTALGRAALTCEHVNTCRMSGNDTSKHPDLFLGGGELEGTVCSSSHDCKRYSHAFHRMHPVMHGGVQYGLSG